MDSLIHRYWSTTYIQTFHPFCQIISENKETYQENASSQKQGTKENWLVENHTYTYMYSNLQNIYISQREPLIQAYYIAHHVPRKRREGWIKNHRLFFFCSPEFSSRPGAWMPPGARRWNRLRSCRCPCCPSGTQSAKAHQPDSPALAWPGPEDASSHCCSPSDRSNIQFEGRINNDRSEK